MNALCYLLAVGCFTVLLAAYREQQIARRQLEQENAELRWANRRAVKPAR